MEGKFSITVEFDNGALSVDYRDGSDTEHYTVNSMDELNARVLEAVGTAMSPEEPDPED